MYDIPNTVAHGTSAVSGLGIDLITIHAGGGRDMMEAAVQAADEADGITGLMHQTSRFRPRKWLSSQGLCFWVCCSLLHSFIYVSC